MSVQDCLREYNKIQVAVKDERDIPSTIGPRKNRTWPTGVYQEVFNDVFDAQIATRTNVTNNNDEFKSDPALCQTYVVLSLIFWPLYNLEYGRSSNDAFLISDRRHLVLPFPFRYVTEPVRRIASVPTTTRVEVRVPSNATPVTRTQLA